MKRKKNQKNMTNEHLLKGKDNNFSLAEAAINIAYQEMELGRDFSLEKVLQSVEEKNQEEATIQDVSEISEDN